MLREFAPSDRISSRADRPIQTIGRRQAVILAVVSSGGAIFLTFCAWHLRHQDPDSVTATLFLGFLIVLVIAIRGGQTPYSVLDPLLLFSLVFFVYFVLHVFWLETGPADRGIFGSGRPYVDVLGRSQFYAAGAYGTMVVGYCAFGFRSRRPGATSAAMKAVSARMLISIFLFGVAANYGGMRLSTAADTANALVFRTLGYFALVAFVVTLIRHATSTDPSRRAFGYLAYGVMLPVLLVSSFAVARGSRTDAAFVVLALLSVRTFFIRPARLGTLAALAVVTLFVLTPTLQALRVQALAESSSAGAVALRNPTRGVLSWTGWDLVNRRTLGGESLALAVKYSPQSLPYQHGRTWRGVAYVFIPHVLWPDKPSGNITTEFSTTYGGLSAARGDGLTLSPTLPGDFYLNFGLVGLLIGFCLLGVYIRAVTAFATPDALAVALYVALITPLVLVDESVSGNMNLLLTRLAATLCVVGLIRLFVTHVPAARHQEPA